MLEQSATSPAKLSLLFLTHHFSKFSRRALLVDPIDEYAITRLKMFDGKMLVCVLQEELEIEDTKGKARKEEAMQFDELCSTVKICLTTRSRQSLFWSSCFWHSRTTCSQSISTGTHNHSNEIRIFLPRRICLPSLSGIKKILVLKVSTLKSFSRMIRWPIT
jgi:hypothetical protein